MVERGQQHVKLRMPAVPVTEIRLTGTTGILNFTRNCPLSDIEKKMNANGDNGNTSSTSISMMESGVLP